MQYEIKPLNLGGILDQGIQLVKNHFGLLFGIVGALILPFMIATVILQMMAPPLPANPTLEDIMRYQNPYRTPSFILTFVWILIAAPVANVALTWAVSSKYLGQPVSVGSAIKRGLGLLAPVVWVNILYSMLIFIGLILFIIPGVIFIFRYMLCMHATIIEGTRGSGSLKRSKEIMTSHRTKHYNTAFLLGLMLFIINLGISSGLPMVIPNPISGFVSAILQSIVFMVTGACWVVFYFSCRSRADGFDLMRLADQVAGIDGVDEELSTES